MATTSLIDLSMIVPMLTALQEEVQKIHAKLDVLLRDGSAAPIKLPSDETFKLINTVDELKQFNESLKSSDAESKANLVST